MKKILLLIIVATGMLACNDAAETKVPEDPTFDHVTVDTMPAGTDTSAMKSDTSKVNKAIRK